MDIDDPDNVLRIDDPSTLRAGLEIGGWQVDASGLELSLWWPGTRVEGRVRVLTSETKDAVHVLGLDSDPLPAGIESGFAGMCPVVIEPVEKRARLLSPLGRRTVIDAVTGRLVVEQPPVSEHLG